MTKNERLYATLLAYQYLSINGKKGINQTELTELLQKELGEDLVKDYRTTNSILKDLYSNKDEFKKLFNVEIIRTGTNRKFSYHIEHAIDHNKAIQLLDAVNHDVLMIPSEANEIENILRSFADNEYLDQIINAVDEHRKIVSKFSVKYEIYLVKFRKAKTNKTLINVTYFLSNDPSKEITIPCYVLDIIRLNSEPNIKVVTADNLVNLVEIPLFNVVTSPVEIKKDKMIYYDSYETDKYKTYEECIDYFENDFSPITIQFCFEKNVNKQAIAIRYKEYYNMFSSIEYNSKKKYISLVMDKETGKIVKDIKLFDDLEEFKYFKNSNKDENKILDPIERECYELEFDSEASFLTWVMKPEIFASIRVLGPIDMYNKLALNVKLMYEKMNDLSLLKKN